MQVRLERRQVTFRGSSLACAGVHSQVVRLVHDDVDYHLLDTGAGTSGGPVWVRKDDKFIVLGVHLSTGGYGAPGKVAVRINPDEIRAIIRQLEN